LWNLNLNKLILCCASNPCILRTHGYRSKHPITKDKTKIVDHVEDNRIGVLDLEVFNDDEPKVYAGGIYTYMSEEDSPLLFYIDETTKDSYSLVLNIINEMLRPKYKGVIFYCHNFVPVLR